MNPFSLILFIAAILFLIGFPIFFFYAVVKGIDNKYSDYDTKMFLEGSNLPTAISKEDKVNIQ
ncbi:MAG: hypothetical protein K5899_02185 [Bacteroidaceae bacterium]|nr:hypothetical protein [Bacteroidaceae bacterium]